MIETIDSIIADKSVYYIINQKRIDVQDKTSSKISIIVSGQWRTLSQQINVTLTQQWKRFTNKSMF